jgi:hypothetical protein
VKWRHWAIWGATLLLVAGGLRLAVLERVGPVELLGDEITYAVVALNIAAGHGAVEADGIRAFRPPGNSFYLSRFVPSDFPARPKGDALAQLFRRLAHAQVALGTLLVLVTAWVASALFDWRVGLVAGGIAAVYPNLVAHSHYLWSENLFALFVMAGLAFAIRGQASKGLGWAVAAGACFGLGGLTREAAVSIAGVCALWWWLTSEVSRRRSALAAGALMLAVTAAILLPWTWRNHYQLGRIVPVSTVGWFVAAEGNTLETHWLDDWGPRVAEFRDRYFALPGDVARLDLAREQAFEQIAAEQPAWIFKKTLRASLLLFWPDSPLLYKLRSGSYGELPVSTRRNVLWLSLGPYLLVALAATFGIAGAGSARPGRRLLPLLILGVVWLPHVLTHANARFRMSWMPLLIIYASAALVQRKELRISRVGWSAIAGVALFLLAFALPRFLARHGAHYLE